MKYRCQFVGRRVGAIGIFYPIQTEVEADDPEQARLKLYETWDHISRLTLTEVHDTQGDSHDKLSEIPVVTQPE